MRVVLHPEARSELTTAAFWYEERRPGLGDEFLAEVDGLLQRIGSSPASFPLWPGAEQASEPVFKAVMHRFPYVLAFELHRDHLLVLAIAHGRRRPLYWISRKGQS